MLKIQNFTDRSFTDHASVIVVISSLNFTLNVNNTQNLNVEADDYLEIVPNESGYFNFRAEVYKSMEAFELGAESIESFRIDNPDYDVNAPENGQPKLLDYFSGATTERTLALVRHEAYAHLAQVSGLENNHLVADEI